METICVVIITILIFFASKLFFTLFIMPKFIEANLKEIERNPKWIVKNNYYGFQDIDIVLAETNLNRSLPRILVTKENRYEFWISNDTTTREVDEVLRLAIMGKIKVKYNLFFPEKPLHWLSILCYMLDGGEIQEKSAKFEEKQETS